MRGAMCSFLLETATESGAVLIASRRVSDLSIVGV
jgi:hypothetical protein